MDRAKLDGKEGELRPRADRLSRRYVEAIRGYANR